MYGQDSDGVYEVFYLIIEMYFLLVKGFRFLVMVSNGYVYFEFMVFLLVIFMFQSGIGVVIQ